MNSHLFFNHSSLFIRHFSLRKLWLLFFSFFILNSSLFITAQASAAPNTPTNSTPANAATNVSRTPTLTASAFSGGSGVHQASQWQIASDAGFSTVVYDTAPTVNLTSHVVSITLNNDTVYYWHVRYQDNTGSWSSYSSGTSFTVLALPSGPTAYWRMNEGSGTAVNDSVGSYNGTIVTGPTWDAAGKYNYALNWAGAGSVSIPDAAALRPSAISVSVWVKLPSGYARSSNIICKSDNSGYRFRIDTARTITWFDRGGTNYITSTAVVPISTWTHIVVVGDSSGLKIYVNGVLDKSNAVAYGAPQATGVVYIGNDVGLSDIPFSGLIDEMIFYGRGLTSTEVQNLYDQWGVHSPAKPTNSSPSQGATGVALNTTLSSSAFSDPDSSPQGASRWQVRKATGAYGDADSYDSNEVAGANVSHTIPGGNTLAQNTQYYWHVQYKDNTGLWSNWSGETSFTTIGNAAPSLAWTGETNYTADGVNPDSALAVSNFEFRVNYTDADNNPPGSIQVWVDINDNGSYESGEKYNMTAVDGGDTTYTDGKLYTKTLAIGKAGDNTLNYRFHAMDSQSVDATGGAPVTGGGTVTVTNNVPVLAWTNETNFTADGVNPDSGNNNDNFEFRVKYTDADNEAPNSIQVWVDLNDNGSYEPGEKFDMTGGDGGDTVYSDGKLYTKSLAIPYAGDGTLNYRFYAKDSVNADATGTPTSNATLSVQCTPARPVNSTPANGATAVSRTPTLTALAYSNCDADTHKASQWRIASDSGFTSIVYDSGPVTNLTSHVVGVTLAASATRYWQVRYQDSAGIWSSYSAGTSFDTAGHLPSGAVAYWSFSEGSGQTAYDSIGGNDGRLGATTGVETSDPTWTSSGKIGYGLSFDAGDYVEVPDSNALDLTTEGTIEIWAKKNANNSSQMYVTKGNTTAYQLLDYTTTGRLSVRWGSNTDNIITNDALPTGVWNHIVVTYDGSFLKIYVNGELVKAASHTTDAVVNTTPVRIGARSDGAYFNGFLDEVVIYNRALTAAEVSARYANINAPNKPSNSSPANGDTGVVNTPTLTASAFSDPDSGAIHAASRWQLRKDGEEYGDADGYDTFGTNLELASLTLDNGPAWQATGWTYRRKIQLSPATSLANYQARISLPTGFVDYSKIKVNGDDLRFYDSNGTSLSYAIETWNTSGESVVWVKVPVSGTSVLYMYYGKATASAASNVDAVFDAIDWTAFKTNWYRLSLSGTETPIGIEMILFDLDLGSWIQDLDVSVSGRYVSDNWRYYGRKEFVIKAGTVQFAGGANDAWVMTLIAEDNTYSSVNTFPNSWTVTKPFGRYVWALRDVDGLYDPDGTWISSITSGLANILTRQKSTPEPVASLGMEDSWNDARNGRELVDGVKYYWRVQYMDNTSAWSQFSDETNFTILGNSAPMLDWTGEANFTTDGVNPNSAAATSNFEFRVKYTDADNNAPASIQVWVDLNDNGTYESGEKYDMTEVNGGDTTYTDGKLYTKTLAISKAGDNTLTYRFYGRDSIGTDAIAGAPVTAGGTLTVTNNAPTLTWTGEANFTTDGANPDSGTNGESFELRVSYTDADNEAPSAIQVWVDLNDNSSYEPGEKFAMTAVNGGDTIYSDGKFYTKTMSIPFAGNGTLLYRYYATDGIDVATGAGVSGGFLVVNGSPAQPVNTLPADATTNVTRTPTLTASAFSDPGSDNHKASRWQIATDANFTAIIYDSGPIADLVSHSVPSTLSGGTTFYWRVCYEDATDAWSLWSNATWFSTLPTAPGGPIANWPLNEGAGAVAHDVANPAHDGTVSGATWVAGKHGMALSFNGSNNYVQIPVSTDFNWGGSTFTISCWFKTSSSAGGTFMRAKSGADDHFGLSINASGQVTFNFASSGTASGSATSAASYNNGQWHHATGIRPTADCGRADLYIDGALVAQDTSCNGPYHGISITTSLYFGRNPDGTNYFNGQLDEIVFYNSALSAADVLALYQGTGSHAPVKPTNTSPAGGATGVPVTPILVSSAFSDQDTGNTHGASRYQVRKSAGTYGDPLTSYDSGEITDLTSHSVPAGSALTPLLNYYWRVQHKDSTGLWSSWSDETIFTTRTNVAPNTPAATSPNGVTVASYRPTLAASVFSDADVGDVHTASQWRLTVVSGDYSFANLAHDSSAAETALTSYTLPVFLSKTTTYFWQVRHRDQGGLWSSWSAEAMFMTPANSGPDKPVNATPANGATGVGRKPLLTASAYLDPDDDPHLASRWQVATDSGFASVVYDSSAITDLTSHTLPTTLLASTTYYWRVRYQDSQANWSDWSDATSFNTSPSLYGAVSYWKFDENSGQSVTDSIGASHGTRGATSSANTDDPTWTTGKQNSGLSFDGGDFVATPFTVTSLTSFTLEAWVKGNSGSSGMWLFGEASGNYFVFGRSSSATTSLSVNMSGVTSATLSFANSNIYDNTWHHVVLTNDAGVSSGLKLYVDGTLRESKNSNGGPTLNSTINIGRRSSGEYWNGLIDEAVIYNLALSADEVLARYEESKVSCSPNKPVNSTPVNSATGVAISPSLTASAFSDPDAGETHSASRWQVRKSSGVFGDSASYDTEGSQTTLTSITLDAGRAWDASAWLYRRQISLSPVTPQANFQVKVSLPADFFNFIKTRPNGEDLRFYDANGTALLYWIADWDTTGTAVVWIKAPVAGTGTLYLYYGNPAAAAESNAANFSAPYNDISIASLGPEDGKGVELEYGTSYSWRVQYRDNTGAWSLFSDETTFTTVNDAVPNAPSGLTATANGACRIDLSWTDNSNGATGNETGFKIEMKKGAGGAWNQVGTVAANETNASVTTGLDPNTTHYFRVRATNSGGDSGYSDEDSAATTAITYYQDSDSDSYGNAAVTLAACDQPNGYVLDNTDCNDANAELHPATIWYTDADADSYSNGATLVQCTDPGAIWYLASDLTTTSGDCNDADATISPATIWYKDTDNDTYSSGVTKTQCADPGTEWYRASQLAAPYGDCNDSNAAIKPGASESCDGVDNDCDSSIDEGFAQSYTYYRDADSDTYGASASALATCRSSAPTGYVSNSLDCNDANSVIKPGATEYCNSIDDNCNGQIDESCVACAGTLAAPSALNASSRNSKIVELAWVDNSDCETGFEIEIQLWNGLWVTRATVGAAIATYTDSIGITPQAQYTYRVRAVKTGSPSSAYSASATVATKAYVAGDTACE